MASQTPGSSSPSNLLTIYGSVSFITYTTTITDSGVLFPAGITIISRPVPTTTDLVQYTSFAIPTDPDSKYFPNSLPIFAATVFEVIVVNIAGNPVSTLIEVQAQPAYVYSAHPAGDTGAGCIAGFYTCWSEGKRAGVIIGIMLGGLIVLLFISWLCCFLRISGSRAPDEEELHDLKSGGREQSTSEDDAGRRRRVSRSTHNRNIHDRNITNRRSSLVSSGSCTEPPKPLPRIVHAKDCYEHRRISRVPRHVRSDSISVSSVGAVLDVGSRDTRRDAVYFPTEAFDPTLDRRATRGNTAATKRNLTTVASAATFSRAVSKPRDLNTYQRRLRRSSVQGRDVEQVERGRSPIRKNSSRKSRQRVQSYSPYRSDSLYRSSSPPIDNRNSFPPYISVEVDLWKKAEQSSPRVVQKISSTSCRGDIRTSRKRLHSSQADEMRRSRSLKQDVSMSGGLEEISAGAPPITRRSNRRRPSYYI